MAQCDPIYRCAVWATWTVTLFRVWGRLFCLLDPSPSLDMWCRRVLVVTMLTLNTIVHPLTNQPTCYDIHTRGMVSTGKPVDEG